MNRSVFIGYDEREADAYYACIRSIARFPTHMHVEPIKMDVMQARGLYQRPHFRRGGQLVDVISEAPCSTEFAITRFLTPYLAGSGWALFMDSDMLVRNDLAHLFALADPRFALQVVKHPPIPGMGVKMDGQAQLSYERKCWSSLMLFNVDHPAVRALDLHMVNTATGRFLHRFDWLPDHLIGELPLSWNWLAGVSEPIYEPDIVHYTLGIPRMAGYENAPYADEWWACRNAR